MLQINYAQVLLQCFWRRIGQMLWVLLSYFWLSNLNYFPSRKPNVKLFNHGVLVVLAQLRILRSLPMPTYTPWLHVKAIALLIPMMLQNIVSRHVKVSSKEELYPTNVYKARPYYMGSILMCEQWYLALFVPCTFK